MPTQTLIDFVFNVLLPINVAPENKQVIINAFLSLLIDEQLTKNSAVNVNNLQLLKERAGLLARQMLDPYVTDYINIVFENEINRFL
jgi:hypothetical protein